MKSKLFLAMLGIMVLAQIADARIIKGRTVSRFPHLEVTAIDIDGSAVTKSVRNVGQEAGPNETLYIGKYNLDVPENAKVTIVFSRVFNNGSVRPKTVARFPNGHGSKATQIPVTPPLEGGSVVIALGLTAVGPSLSTSSLNPLDDVDLDDDGECDLDDLDDDNDGIEDDADVDADDDGIEDADEDMDLDDDNRPDVIDADDDDDEVIDSLDPDDDNDGIEDADEPDSDEDGVEDADDVDDDNDGLSDDDDDDDDGDGLDDDEEL